MLSIALFHWISSGSCCKPDIMWIELLLPSRLYVQSISLEIKKYPGFKCQSSILVGCSVQILFFWLWKSIWRAFSISKISLSTILLSVCSNPITIKIAFNLCLQNMSWNWIPCQNRLFGQKICTSITSYIFLFCK